MAKSLSSEAGRAVLVWTGIPCAVANGLTLQALSRYLPIAMDGTTVTEPMRWGWLTLSHTTAPASWFYWASHVWLILASLHVRQSLLGSNPDKPRLTVAILALVVLLEVLALHGMVWMIQPYWGLTPPLL
jgi:hypothetical protein